MDLGYCCGGEGQRAVALGNTVTGYWTARGRRHRWTGWGIGRAPPALASGRAGACRQAGLTSDCVDTIPNPCCAGGAAAGFCRNPGVRPLGAAAASRVSAVLDPGQVGFQRVDAGGRRQQVDRTALVEAHRRRLEPAFARARISANFIIGFVPHPEIKIPVLHVLGVLVRRDHERVLPRRQVGVRRQREDARRDRRIGDGEL